MLKRLLLAALVGMAVKGQDPAVELGRGELRAALESIGKAGEMGVDVTIAAGATAREGYEWRSEGGRVKLRAGTALGAAYGLERLAWLARATRTFPVPDGAEAPAMGLRLMFISSGVPDSAAGPSEDDAAVAKVVGEFRETLKDVLKFGYNGVVFRGLEHYVPSSDGVYGPRSARYRKYLKAIIAEAHAHHVGVYPYAEEAIYLPAWLEAAGARASVKDARFWEVMADKYRRLFQAVPELDGVTPCVGEIIPSYEFRALDIVHAEGGEPDLKLEERYRAFFGAVHKVVAGEFGKVMLPWTWATNDWELSASPDVYRGVFGRLPVDGLMPVIKLTKHDAWYYGTAYNPTFGLGRQPTMALAELGSQYQGFGTVADFPARWAAAALQHAAERGAEGVMAGRPLRNLLQPGVLYVFSRMSWNPKGDADAVAREWAAATFGPAAAEEVARILLMGSDASRKGFYWEAVARDGWPPQPHIRVNQFVLKGNAFWDRGREHDGFLRGLYLKLKPYAEEVYANAGEAAEIVGKMQRIYEEARGRMDAAAGERLGGILRHHAATAALTRDYTRLILRYFEYRERRTAAAREGLARAEEEMARTAAAYRASHKFFELAGIDQTVELASRALRSLEEAERILREAPTPAEITERIAAARKEDDRLLAAHGEAEVVLRWKGSVDARNILRVQGEEIKMERLTGDGIHAVEARFARPLGREEGWRYAVRLLRPRGIVHLMEQPGAGNGYTASLYVDDPEPSSAVLEFELLRWRQ